MKEAMNLGIFTIEVEKMAADGQFLVSYIIPNRGSDGDVWANVIIDNITYRKDSLIELLYKFQDSIKTIMNEVEKA